MAIPVLTVRFLTVNEKIGCGIFITIKLPKVGPHSCFVPIRLKAGPLMTANSLGVNTSGQDVADFALRKTENGPPQKMG